MPALPPYVIEPIWEQFMALLPPRKAYVHPLGCHRQRAPGRLVFDRLVQVLVFGWAYERIADESCSVSTLRRRRDEWIGSGAMEKLRGWYSKPTTASSAWISRTWPSIAASQSPVWRREGRKEPRG